MAWFKLLLRQKAGSCRSAIATGHERHLPRLISDESFKPVDFILKRGGEHVAEGFNPPLRTHSKFRSARLYNECMNACHGRNLGEWKKVGKFANKET